MVARFLLGTAGGDAVRALADRVTLASRAGEGGRASGGEPGESNADVVVNVGGVGDAIGESGDDASIAVSMSSIARADVVVVASLAVDVAGVAGGVPTVAAGIGTLDSNRTSNSASTAR
jgi:hypothetical protein